MATQSSILARRIPWTEEFGGLQGRRELDTTEWLSTHTCCIQSREEKVEGKHSQTHTAQWPSANGRA